MIIMFNYAMLQVMWRQGQTSQHFGNILATKIQNMDPLPLEVNSCVKGAWLVVSVVGVLSLSSVSTMG